MKEHVTLNKAAWEEAFAVRATGFGEDHADRLRTETFPFLHPAVVDAVRALPLAGASIGQLCCNNGRELMSVVRGVGAREGVGFDIAANILGQARAIAAETGTPCTFVQGDVCEMPPVYANQFDLVLVTIGALCWMEQLQPFFAKAAQCLKPGGTLLVYEIHPVADMFAVPDEAAYDPQDPAKILYSYFRQEPFVDNFGMGYLAGKAYESKPFVSFSHTLGEMLTAIAQNGLRLTRLTEFDYDVSGNTQALTGKGIPLSYLLLARKD